MRRVLALAATLAAVSGAAASSSTGDDRPRLTFTRLLRGKTDVESAWVAAVDGSHARRVSRRGFDGKLSGDGRWLTFERDSGKPDVWELFLVDLTTGKSRSLGTTTGNECWSPVRAQFAVSQPGGFYLVDAASGSRTKLLPAKVSSCDFSPDGASIALAAGSLDDRTSFPPSDVFLLRLADHSLRRLTYDRHSRSPLVTRSGIAYVRFGNRFTWPEVWWMRLDGGGRRLLARCCETKYDATHVGYRGFEPIGMSGNGHRLLVCKVSEQSCDPLVIDLPSGRRHWVPTQRIAAGAHDFPAALDLSRDGRTVLVVIGPWDDEPGIDLLYALPVTEGKPKLLARDVAFASWRR